MRGEQSVPSSVSASPPMALPPTMLSSWTRVLQKCTVVCTLGWEGVLPTPTIAGDVSLFWRIDEGERVNYFLLLYLYRGFIAVLKYVRSYLHSLGLVTETNKK